MARRLMIERRSTSGGGKGRPKSVDYSYSTSFAVARSARRVREVRRIWADGKLLRGAGGDFKVKAAFRFYDGDEDQTVDPLIASAEGTGGARAFRGIAYAMFEELELAEFGNRISYHDTGCHYQAGLQRAVAPGATPGAQAERRALAAVLTADEAKAAEGESWIVAAGASGEWAGQAGRVAIRTAGGWRFLVPLAGMSLWDGAAGYRRHWTGSAWSDGKLPVAGILVGGKQVVGNRLTAVPSPSGGTTIDAEARAAIAALTVTLKTHGLTE